MADAANNYSSGKLDFVAFERFGRKPACAYPPLLSVHFLEIIIDKLFNILASLDDVPSWNAGLVAL